MRIGAEVPSAAWTGAVESLEITAVAAIPAGRACLQPTGAVASAEAEIAVQAVSAALEDAVAAASAAADSAAAAVSEEAAAVVVAAAAGEAGER